MATSYEELQSATSALERRETHVRTLPLCVGDVARAVAWRNGRFVALAEFRMHVANLARELPASGAMINLCEDRYHFLVAYAAAASIGHTVLLPASRAADVVSDVQRTWKDSYRCEDAMVTAVTHNAAVSAHARDRVSENHVVMVGYTSGSTGIPKRHPKTWRMVHGSNAQNAATLRVNLRDARPAMPATIIATVPPQHMYGMEMSVLLPLIGGFAVHAGRPLFPADVAAALADVPEPRILVSTPVHLRTLVEAAQTFPKVELVISATAPLDSILARAVEERLGTRLLEMFGSTETCVIATRRTAHEQAWVLYPGVELTPCSEGTRVMAPWFVEPVMLQDIVELTGPRTFTVKGRNTDMIEVAGKRASLGDLTRRLLAIPGVQDAAVFQPDAPEGRVMRVAALVVAPGMSSRQILDRLAPSVDPAFLPRPLRLVQALPRNELGKLPRERLLAALRAAE